MDSRQRDLSELKGYLENVDKEVNVILENFGWDQKHIVEKNSMVTCAFNNNHKIPDEGLDIHEYKCYLTKQGYSKDAILLPDPVDANADTVVKLSKQDITNIINQECRANPTFRRALSLQTILNMIVLHAFYILIVSITQGVGCSGPEPLTLERLQHAYTADERRAIHDAVVNTAPACHDLTDLALVSVKQEGSSAKSRLEILAELRDMRRRRAKYRVAAKSGNYSHALRDVIRTQMESYAEAKGITIDTESRPKSTSQISANSEYTSDVLTEDIVIKQERISPSTNTHSQHRHDSNREREREIQHDDYRKKRDRDRYAEKDRRRDDEERRCERRERSGREKEGRERYSDKYKRYYDYPESASRVKVKTEQTDEHRDRRTDSSRRDDRRRHHITEDDNYDDRKKRKKYHY